MVPVAIGGLQSAGLRYDCPTLFHSRLIVTPELRQQDLLPAPQADGRTPYQATLVIGSLLYLDARQVVERELPHPPTRESKPYEPQAALCEIELHLCGRIPRKPPQGTSTHADS
jgi:hypothetical protein